MKNTQKMILIPHEKYERMRQQNIRKEEEIDSKSKDQQVNEKDISNFTLEDKEKTSELPTNTTEKQDNLTKESNSTPQSPILNDKIEEKKIKKKRKRFPPPGIPYEVKEKKQKLDWKDLWVKH